MLWTQDLGVEHNCFLIDLFLFFTNNGILESFSQLRSPRITRNQSAVGPRRMTYSTSSVYPDYPSLGNTSLPPSLGNMSLPPSLGNMSPPPPAYSVLQSTPTLESSISLSGSGSNVTGRRKFDFYNPESWMSFYQIFSTLGAELFNWRQR